MKSIRNIASTIIISSILALSLLGLPIVKTDTTENVTLSPIILPSSPPAYDDDEMT